MESRVSKHLLRRDIERDPDHINTMLWKRKLYKKRVQRNEVKKVRKHFFKEQEAPQQQGETVQDAKKMEFYKQLFEKKEGEEEVFKKKKKKKHPKVVTGAIDNPDNEVKVEAIPQAKEEEKKGGDTINQQQRPSGSFNYKLERIRQERENKAKLREEREQLKLKQIKKKAKYAKKLRQKTSKGQPLMKNLISHYLSKIEKERN